MASSDIRIFNWYQKYIVKAADMTNLQMWLRNMFEGTFEGALGGSVLKGCENSLGSGLTINIAAGICVSPSGRIIVISAGSATYASPAGNPAKSLVVARPKLTDSTNIPQPTNPSNSVPLYEVLEYDLVVLNGTPAGSPVYPTPQADDVIISAVSLVASQSTLALTDIDYGKIDRPRKRRNKVKIITSDYSMDGSERILEADFSAASGIITLPPPADFPGEEFTIVKTDATSNDVAVTGETISGQLPVLDTQWEVLNFYSNGTSYRSK